MRFACAIFLFMLALPWPGKAQFEEEYDALFSVYAVDLKNPKAGQFIRLAGVYFPHGDEPYPEWHLERIYDSLVKIINYNPDVLWAICSFTDCRASREYNDRLSQRRADTVIKMLIGWGADKKRLSAIGYGERWLLNHCACEPNDQGPGVNCREAEHQVNRRTELRVIGTHTFSNKPYTRPSNPSAPASKGFTEPDTTIDFRKPKKGQYIRPEGIYFDLDQSTIRPQCYAVLDRIAQMCKANPCLSFEIGTHTDCRASKEYNEGLSQRRADAIRDYLVSKGVKAEMLVAVGYGESKLLNKCACEPNDEGPGKDCTEVEHGVNRRTEFKVIEVDKRCKKSRKKG